ncbi:FtsB family cell division protein [Namhaeicola litoreus]|uniref:Septum formation initiator family protein n=1 Tax=Namhaeicola litoreus TaxID=1052145 RepID=A0ABW3Y6P4_9FLAO
MKLNDLKKNRTFKVISNKYFLVLLPFVVWMIFFDENSYVNQRELNKELNDLESSIDYYQKEIESDEQLISNLKNEDSLEKFGREHYKMKKENEDIYLIEFDTVKE